MTEPFDLPWIMTKLRALVETYEATPYIGDPDLRAILRVTYRHRDNPNEGITLVIGTEPAGKDDDEC